MMPSPELSADQALEFIKGAAARNQLHYTKHAKVDRMHQRGVQAVDVKAAVLSAKRAIWREEDRSWKLVDGHDFDGESLEVAVSIEGNIVRVVTVF